MLNSIYKETWLLPIFNRLITENTAKLCKILDEYAESFLNPKRR